MYMDLFMIYLCHVLCRVFGVLCVVFFWMALCCVWFIFCIAWMGLVGFVLLYNQFCFLLLIIFNSLVSLCLISLSWR